MNHKINMKWTISRPGHNKELISDFVNHTFYIKYGNGSVYQYECSENDYNTFVQNGLNSNVPSYFKYRKIS
jgi:hypothetical protein